MSIFLQLLLSMLPQLLEWLMSLFKKNKQPTAREMKLLNQIVWFMNQVPSAASKVGASKSGTAPDDA